MTCGKVAMTHEPPERAQSTGTVKPASGRARPLFRSIGNQAMGNLLALGSGRLDPHNIIQRKAACSCGGECPRCQQKSLQTKLAVSQPGDTLEQEADRVADQVLSAPANPAVIHRSPQIQRFAGSGGGQGQIEVPPSVSNLLASPGRPLDQPVQHDMEQRFGHDFSGVRVHTDSAAEQSAKDVSAHAYTVGHHIAFDAGRFAPGEPHGRRLIAHELTHVLQQAGLRATPDSLRDSRSIGARNSQTIAIQKQEKPSTSAATVLQDYKPVDQLAGSWGGDFLRGFRQSGAISQLSRLAVDVLETGLEGSPEHRREFEGGVLEGIPEGILEAGASAAKSLAILILKSSELWWRLHLTPIAVANELKAIAKSTGLTMVKLLDTAEPFGLYVGKTAIKEATKFGIEFVNSGGFGQGRIVGRLIGRLVGEVALLFVGVEEVSIAAKALRSTRVGMELLTALEDSRILKPFLKIAEGSEAAKAAKATEEAGELSKPLKGAEETRPAAGASRAAEADAGRSAPRTSGKAGVVTGEGAEVVTHAEQAAALERSAAKAGLEELTAQELEAELDFVRTKDVKATFDPNFAGEVELPHADAPGTKGHTWKVKESDGAWCRFSPVKPNNCVPASRLNSRPRPIKSAANRGEPGSWLPDFELGRNMSASDRAYQIKCGGRKAAGYYVNGIQFDTFDQATRQLVDAKNWAADGVIVRALRENKHWAGWKVVNQAQDQIRAANGVPIVWRVASQEAKDAIDPIFAAWRFTGQISVVVF